MGLLRCRGAGVLLCLIGISAIITAVVGFKPKLEIQPGSPVVRPVGSSLALTCRPNVEDPKLITQLEWKDPKNRRIDEKNQNAPLYIERLKEEVASILIFSSLTENLAGQYTCSASYANSEMLVERAQVTTIVDITWINAPESQYTTVGQNYLVLCEVKANPAPNVNWLKNGEEIDLSVSNRYIANNTGLTIKNVRESDDGIYTCKAVVFKTGEIKTRNIKLEVQIVPRVAPMDTIEVVEGEEASAQCNGTGKPPPSYTWIKENTRENLSNSDRFTVKRNSGLLIIHRVEFNDDSFYKCVAKNSAGQNETRVKINVLVKPKIFELLNVTANVNQSTKITCRASGRPAPKVYFRKLSNKLPYAFGVQSSHPGIILENFPNHQKGETVGILNFDRLYRSDDGLYECIAENKVEAGYKNGHIAVQFPPTFEKTADYPPAWSWPGHPGNLTCIAESIPNATIQWRYQNLIIERDTPQIKIVGTGPISHLIIDPMNDNRLYATFECVASNILGSAIKPIELRKATVPQHIQQVRLEDITATTIKFTIVGPPNYYGLPLRSIVVQYQTERERSWDTAKEHIWSYNASYILEYLTPEEVYNFRFAAVNDVGIGGWSANQQHGMPRRSVPVEPKIIVEGHIPGDDINYVATDVVTDSKFADHYRLQWTVPHDNGDPIDFYLIKYCVTQKVNGMWRTSDSECSEEIKQSFQYTSYDLNNLSPDTTYKVELKAHNAIGLSSPSEIRVRTARGLHTTVYSDDNTVPSSAAIIGIVVSAILLVILIVDVMCCCVNRAGILACLCDRLRSKPVDEEDPKLGSDEKEPLKHSDNGNPPLLLNGNMTPSSLQFDDKQSTVPTSVQYDGKQVYTTKSGEIIGKHSVV